MGKALELTREELEWCRLRARGYCQVEAYEQAFPGQSRERKSATEAASRVAKRPQVRSMLKQLFAEAKKLALLSHCEYLDGLIADHADAKAAGNWTATASFARLVGQCLGALSETLNIADARMSDEQLLDRLAGQDPILAEALRTRLKSRETFH